MPADVSEIQQNLIEILKSHIGPLKIRQEVTDTFEVCGTIPAMQGKKKVDGYYFASVIPKPKDVRLYFFPIYTHADHFADIPPELRKNLKGKSCFHIKNWDDALQDSISDMVKKGLSLYQQDGLI